MRRILFSNEAWQGSHGPSCLNPDMQKLPVPNPSNKGGQEATNSQAKNKLSGLEVDRKKRKVGQKSIKLAARMMLSYLSVFCGPQSQGMVAEPASVDTRMRCDHSGTATDTWTKTARVTGNSVSSSYHFF